MASRRLWGQSWGKLSSHSLTLLMVTKLYSAACDWITILLLCTSASLVSCSNQFDYGSGQVKRDLVDLVIKDYDKHCAGELPYISINNCEYHQVPVNYYLPISMMFMQDWSVVFHKFIVVHVSWIKETKTVCQLIILSMLLLMEVKLASVRSLESKP